MTKTFCLFVKIMFYVRLKTEPHVGFGNIVIDASKMWFMFFNYSKSILLHVANFIEFCTQLFGPAGPP